MCGVIRVFLLCGFLKTSIDVFSMDARIHDSILSLEFVSNNTLACDTVPFLPEVFTPGQVWGNIAGMGSFAVPKKSKPGKPFDESSFQNFHSEALKEAEKKGYPFANSTFASVRFRSDTLDFDWKFTWGPKVIWDSIVVLSEGKIPNQILKSTSGISINSLFDEDKFREVKQRLAALPYVELTKEPEVVFTENGAVLLLQVKKKKANRANLLIAIQPRESGKGYYPVGEANLLLINSLNKGERLALDWKSLGGGSQNTYLSFATPQLFNSPIGLNGSVKLQKLDTTFSSFYPLIGPSFRLNASTEAGISYGVMKSGFGKNSGSEAKNISEKRVVTKFTHKNFDRIQNPSKGLSVDLEIITGQKSTERFVTENEPASVKRETRQFRFQCQVARLNKLLPRWTLLTAVTVGQISNKNEKVFQSEMFRAGGLQTLRGYDEESIFTPRYEAGTIEMRYLIDRTSNVHVFCDGMRLQSDFFRQGQTSLPLGIGAGFSFGAGGLVFTMDYAIGGDSEDGFPLRNNRVHFGFAGIF